MGMHVAAVGPHVMTEVLVVVAVMETEPVTETEVVLADFVEVEAEVEVDVDAVGWTVLDVLVVAVPPDELA